MPEFALAKALRLLFVACFTAKTKGKALLWTLVSVSGGYYLFQYEFTRQAWEIPNCDGLLWLLMFVFSDSFTAVVQDEIYRRFQVNNVVMLFYINLFVCAALLPHMYMYMNVDDLYNNVRLLMLLSLSSMCAQYFTLRIIQQFGATVFVAVCLCKTVYTVFVATVAWNGSVDYIEVLEIVLFTIFLTIAYTHRNTSRSVSSL
jgi:hypothetical protein